MGIDIPAIATQSQTKRAEFNRFKQQIPQNIEIKFCNANGNNKLDPKEWIEYEQNGQRIVGYSPFGNKNSKDTPATIAKRLGASEADIQRQTGDNINPNSFLRFVLPKKKPETTIQQPTTTAKEASLEKSAKPTPAAKPKEKPKAETAKLPTQVVPEPTVKDAQKTGKYEVGTYRVKKGDNPSKLSYRLNTTENELMEYNNVEDPKKLKVGQTLTYYSNRERYGFNSSIPDSVYLAALSAKTEGAFKGKENVILQAAKANNVPVSTMYAIMTQETRHGTSNYVKDRNNPGGIKVRGTETHRTFKTLDAGIKEMARILSLYHKQGLDTLPEIREKYSEDRENWVKNTTKFQNQFCEALTKAEANEATKKAKK